MKVDNLVILGKAVPEKSLKLEAFVTCVNAYHPDLGLIRIWPCRASWKMKRWDVLSCELKRKEGDSRPESWQFVDSDLATVHVPYRVKDKLTRKQSIELLDGLSETTCIRDINAQRRSITLLKPLHYELIFDSTSGQVKEGNCPDPWMKTKNDYPIYPRMRYHCNEQCAKGNGHNASILDWQAYEWMRKYPDKIEQLIDNWRLNLAGYDHWFIVGNQCYRRTAFMITQVLTYKRV